MKTLDFNAVLRDFRYKPNFGYGAYQRDGFGGEKEWWIRIIMLVENSRDPWKQWELKPVPQDEELWYMDRYMRPTRGAGFSPSREVIEVVGNYPIPYFEEEHELVFIEWMVRTIKQMEMHETDEWARYKGELLHDPHAKD